MKIAFATANKGKLREAREILGASFEVVSLEELGVTEDIPETGSTLAENSAQKAHYIYDRFGIDCFADDTGLEVDALDGAPGIYSARYAEVVALRDGKSPEDASSVDHDFKANIGVLLSELDAKGDVPRTARFRCVVTLIKDGREYAFDGRMDGRIADEPAGCGGFGYDSVFIADELPGDATLAELPEECKNTVSHRGRSLRAMADFLKNE